MKRILLPGLLLPFFVSCGLGPESKKQETVSKQVESLMGKTSAEILKLKYNNQIFLNCQLRVQKGTSVDPSVKPSAEFTWDIPGELIAQKSLRHSLSNTKFEIDFDIDDKLEFTDTVTHVGDDQSEYYMEHSPILAIHFESIALTKVDEARRSFDGDQGELDLYENVEKNIYTKNRTSPEGPIVEDLRCTLKTQIQPAYKNQWQKIK